MDTGLIGEINSSYKEVIDTFKERAENKDPQAIDGLAFLYIEAIKCNMIEKYLNKMNLVSWHIIFDVQKTNRSRQKD